jgi:glutamate synthase (NADPH/NADH) large chain
MVDLIPLLDFGQRDLVRHLVESHARLTGSGRARRVLAQGDNALRKFVAVVPREYRKALERQAEAEAARAVSGGRHGLAIVDARSDRHG